MLRISCVFCESIHYSSDLPFVEALLRFVLKFIMTYMDVCVFLFSFLTHSLTDFIHCQPFTEIFDIWTDAYKLAFILTNLILLHLVCRNRSNCNLEKNKRHTHIHKMSVSVWHFTINHLHTHPPHWLWLPTVIKSTILLLANGY